MKYFFKTAVFLLVIFFPIAALLGVVMKKNHSGPVSAETILEQIAENEPVFYENAVVTGTLDFTKLPNRRSYGYNRDQVYVPVPLVFVNCVFEKPVVAKSSQGTVSTFTSFNEGVSFIKCEFMDTVDFASADFRQNTNFTSSVFRNVFNVQNAAFSGTQNYLGEMTVKGDFFAQGAAVRGPFNLMKTSFEKTAQFQSCTFGGELQCNAASFIGYADFTNITASGNVFFNYAKFMNKAVFNNTVFRNRTEFGFVQFGSEASLRGCGFLGKTKFNDISLSVLLDLSDSYFLLGYPNTSNFSVTGAGTLTLENTIAFSAEPMKQQIFYKPIQ